MPSLASRILHGGRINKQREEIRRQHDAVEQSATVLFSSFMSAVERASSSEVFPKVFGKGGQGISNALLARVQCSPSVVSVVSPDRMREGDKRLLARLSSSSPVWFHIAQVGRVVPAVAAGGLVAYSMSDILDAMGKAGKAKGYPNYKEPALAAGEGQVAIDFWTAVSALRHYEAEPTSSVRADCNRAPNGRHLRKG